MSINESKRGKKMKNVCPSLQRPSNSDQNLVTFLRKNYLHEAVFFEKIRSSSASQEIPRIVGNQDVHYRVHKDPSLVSILSHINRVHAKTSRSLRFPNFPAPPPFVPHVTTFPFFFIESQPQYLVRSTNHVAPQCAISTIPLLPL